MKSISSAIGEGGEQLIGSVAPARRRTRLDTAVARIINGAARLPDRLTARLWAAVKLALAAPFAVPTALAVFATVPGAARKTRRRAQRFPSAILTGDTDVTGTLTHLDPGARYLITSDLHRCLPGARDWPRTQHTAEVYDVVLDHYATAEWGLIEAGDVEDVWMVGGSAIGAAVDALRLAGGALAPINSRLSHATSREQLRAIMANHGGTYRRLADRFCIPGRYWRLSGNHDDALGRPEVAEVVADQLPGFALSDTIALGQPGAEPEAVISHGHLTDPWNGPVGAWRGRIVTWIANTIADLRGRELGIMDARAREALLTGRAGNRLRAIPGAFSLDRDQFTLDESALHEAFVDRFGVNRGPWLVLGHTHIPGDGPWDPGRSSRYDRYVNAGSGVTDRVITAVEWDGTGEERRPVLVAFGTQDDLPIALTYPKATDDAHRLAVRASHRSTIGTLRGQPVVRVELRAPTG
ncbi:MAG: hypothetical protein R2754_10155 [Microthrixaceae bacterium]